MRGSSGMYHRAGLALAIVAVLLVAGCLGNGADEEMDPQIAEVTDATSSYQDLSAAQADGYVKFSVHVPGMGVHYLHESTFNDDATSAMDRSLDRTEPEVLVYVDEGDDEPDWRLVAAEYAVPVEDGDDGPPQEAVDLFDEADASDWHIHPSRHELRLGSDWTVHAECHYEGGPGVWLAENPNGTFVQMTPKGQVGTWNGTVEPAACPETVDGDDMPPLMLVHGKWWTLHAWIGLDNPQGVFHPTNPDVGS